MACAEVGEGQVGAKNTELDSLMAWGKGLLVRGYKFPSSLTPHEHHGGIPPSL